MHIIKDCKTPFYLTGGTALSRFYFNHRYSDDLDFFMLMNDHFSLFFEKVYDQLSINQVHLQYDIDLMNIRKHDNFAQLFLIRKVDEPPTTLKLDFVNDIETHYEGFLETRFGLIDSWQNILSNKISALYRLEAKDVADIWIISKRQSFNWETIITQAASKDAGVEPTAIAEILYTFPAELISAIKWAMDIDPNILMEDIRAIAADILHGRNNTLAPAP